MERGERKGGGREVRRGREKGRKGEKGGKGGRREREKEKENRKGGREEGRTEEKGGKGWKAEKRSGEEGEGFTKVHHSTDVINHFLAQTSGECHIFSVTGEGAHSNLVLSCNSHTIHSEWNQI